MLILTPTAVDKINDLIAKRSQTVGIRVGVKTTGCSGLAYTLEYVDNIDIASATYYDCDTIPVFINNEHIVYFHGVTLDWQRKGLNEGFEFINPNERDRCGCGESFRV
jgi:iron-sulfur cluster assembly protein